MSELLEKRLSTKISALTKIVNSIKNIYNSEKLTSEEKSFIETTVGAAIFYLPDNKITKLWTGLISVKAIESFRNIKPSLSKDHFYPRKHSAKELLKNKESLSEKYILDKYLNKFGKYNFVTSEENKKLVKFQKSKVFSTPEESYEKANIKLIKINELELEELKKPIHNNINKLLQRKIIKSFT